MSPSSSNRGERLEAARTGKMAKSTHAYVRGNAVKFYEPLAGSPAAQRLLAGPTIWICGDCHLGNRWRERPTRARWMHQRAPHGPALCDHGGIGIEAPAWLWRAVVDLSGSHEAGYHEHCRRHALEHAEKAA